MKNKVALVGILFCLFISNVFAKSPPLGTGALVPTNIMLMLDNSGSMAWDLSGNQLNSNSFLNNPTDINIDSKGNIYVWSSSNTVIEGKNYKLLVFNPDGTFKKQLDISRIKSLGWKPKIKFDDGLESTIDEYIKSIK